MKTLEFIEGNPPAGYKADAEQYLFNTPEHRLLQASKNWMSFHLIHREKKSIRASLHLHLEGVLAESPHRAPFGSITFSDKLLPEDLYEFIYTADARLRSKGIKRVVLRNPPQVYQPSRSVIASVVLMNAGYSVIRSEINASIPVDERKFSDGIDSWEHRKLKQAKKAALVCRQLPVSKIDEVYTFISVCREERGQSLSMNLDELKKTVAALSRSFLLFGVFRGDEMVASSVAIRVSKRILYNFYSAHPRRFDAWSPVVLLTEGLYEWCQQQAIEILDLGTSALGDVPNFGLLDFKLRLGGIPSARFTYGKDLV